MKSFTFRTRGHQLSLPFHIDGKGSYEDTVRMGPGTSPD